MDDTIRVCDLISDSIVDGPGLRLAVFTQGCPHKCPGCHNPQSHDPQGGYELSIAEIVRRASKNPLLSGITLTGGEPLEQADACLKLVRALPKTLSVWLYSGYTFEEILQSGDGGRIELLRACEVLVDGRFLQAERSLDLRFRGSRNQRLLDLPKSIARKKAVAWEAPVW